MSLREFHTKNKQADVNEIQEPMQYFYTTTVKTDADNNHHQRSVWVRLSCTIVLLLSSLSGHAQTSHPADSMDNAAVTSASKWLISDLAAAVDLVALVQVEQTQYKYRRGFPVDGYADLRMLIPYKQDVATELIRVRESGLRDNACYFPRTFLGDEGPRYLVFLAAAENNDADLREYVGHPMGCKLSVLVNREHDYVLRYPLDGNIRLSQPQQEWIKTYDFSDPAAFAGEPELTPGRKQALAERVDGVVDERGVKYTRGIHIRHFRELIGKVNLRRPDRGGKY